jgi:hypothetical protein
MGCNRYSIKPSQNQATRTPIHWRMRPRHHAVFRCFGAICINAMNWSLNLSAILELHPLVRPQPTAKCIR